MNNIKLLKKFIQEALQEQEDYSVVNDIPIDPNDIDQNGEIEDDKLDKYDSSKEDDVLKDKKRFVDEFSSCGGGSIVGYAGNNSNKR